MIYNGQLDVIVAWPLTEKFLTTLDWSAAHNLTGTMRTQWHVGDDLAGYIFSKPGTTRLSNYYRWSSSSF